MPPVVQNLVYCQLDAVDRCARARPHFSPCNILTSLQIERIGSREGAGVTRTGRVGSANEHFAHIGDERDKTADAIAVEAVVVGNENEGSVFVHHCTNLRAAKVRKKFFKATAFS